MAAGRELRHPWGRTANVRPGGAGHKCAGNKCRLPGTSRHRHTSKSETAKQEAGDVAHQATDSAQHVAETAKAEAANVAGEVKANAKDLLYQAKTDLTDQAGAQQQKVAHGLHSISGELRTMADASEQPGVATDLIRQAADRSASVASWLEGRDPGSLLNEVKTFARQRPGTFLLLAAGAGILAGRLTRSLSEGAPELRRRRGRRTCRTCTDFQCARYQAAPRFLCSRYGHGCSAAAGTAAGSERHHGGPGRRGSGCRNLCRYGRVHG